MLACWLKISLEMLPCWSSVIQYQSQSLLLFPSLFLKVLALSKQFDGGVDFKQHLLDFLVPARCVKGFMGDHVNLAGRITKEVSPVKLARVDLLRFFVS
jgi:hypothetical protein